MSTSTREPVAAARSRLSLCLIHASTGLPDDLGRLPGRFVVRCLEAGGVPALSADDLDGVVADADALLVEWSEAGVPILLALKGAARRRRVPLLALCRPNAAAQVAALYVGADDLLVLPVSAALLEAKVFAFARRAGASPSSPPAGDGALPALRPTPPLSKRQPTAPAQLLALPADHDLCHAGPFTLDRTARRFYACGHLLELTPTEFELLTFFVLRPGTCQTRDATLDAVWGIDFETGTNTLDVHIYALRRKLRAHDLGHLIETVRGVGFRLNV